MKVEVLASVMNASLPETVQHMNLQSDAVIINPVSYTHLTLTTT